MLSKEIERKSLPVPISLTDKEEKVNKDERNNTNFIRWRITPYFSLERMCFEKESLMNRILEEEARKKAQELQLKEHRMRLERTKATLVKKKYTYDFNGNLMFCKNINHAKFPPSTYVVE